MSSGSLQTNCQRQGLNNTVAGQAMRIGIFGKMEPAAVLPKSECLSKLVLLGESHLRDAVHEYLEPYHRVRNHRQTWLMQRPCHAARTHL